MSTLASGAIVEIGTLLKVVLYALILGLGVTVVFAVGVSSVAALLDAFRGRRTLAGVAWAAVAVGCTSGVLAAIVLGIIVMTRK